jgi:hypothetical protein
VESGRDFNTHIDRLIRAIEQILGVKSKVAPPEVAPLISPAPPQKKAWPKPLALGLAGLIAAAGLAAGAWLWLGSDLTQTTGEPAGFCDDLRKVIFEARGQFTSILGPLKESRNPIVRV